MKFQTQIRYLENPNLKYVLLDFFKNESNLILLDGNASKGDSFEWVVAAGTVDEISVGSERAFEQIQDFHNRHKDWVFGSMSYDLKNGLEQLESNILMVYRRLAYTFSCPNICLCIARITLWFITMKVQMNLIQLFLKSILMVQVILVLMV